MANNNKTVYIRDRNLKKWESLKPSPAKWVNEKLEEREAKEEINEVIKGEFIPIKLDQWGNPITEDEV